MKSILLVEDEPRMRQLVGLYLNKAGLHVIEAENGQQGLSLFQQYQPELVLLDIMLPDIDGWAVCRLIRKHTANVPIVILTARLTEEDELFGFELGADEYITKPFNPNILVARVKSALKKYTANSGCIQHKALKINHIMHQVICQEQTIELSAMEYKLLYFLASNPMVALARERILNQVWGSSDVADRVVDTTIKRLRQKLPVDYIKTLRGFGYRFDANS